MVDSSSVKQYEFVKHSRNQVSGRIGRWSRAARQKKLALT